jgi:WD40 repeat protein
MQEPLRRFCLARIISSSSLVARTRRNSDRNVFGSDVPVRAKRQGYLAVARLGPSLALPLRVLWRVGNGSAARFTGNSTIVRTTVKPDEGLLETQPAGPSPTDATLTSAPVGSSQPMAGRPSLAPQPRDHARYDILAEHGRGGLGRVSRAHDRELGRDIAIKELISRGHVSEVRFLREALITARLEHPGIVPVYEAGRWPDGTPFYAMKLVAGRPLRDLIRERKTVDERIGLLHHVIAVADAIAYAQGRNIIHRDLKPSNVIVGDFGETVVIDWGLAKDLTAGEESAIGGGPFRVNPNDDLTSTGAVLGTPAYMAPEQGRGEPVDKRADVYAIGAMLWELCSLEKLPPASTGQRRRILRRAGIDQDLAVIIEKACAADPAQRYLDAGALAADLRAFNAGARIAARRYSPLARLAHWARRHRTLALSAATMAAILIVGVAAYVRNIAVERDRADAALAQSEAAKNDLTLERAELLLRSDPTAAAASLAGYRGNDDLRRRRLLAEATGLGVATHTFAPHGDMIWFLLGESSGAVVSLGGDGRIARTRDGRSTPLATDVALEVHAAYARSTRILAYAASPTGVGVLRLGDQTSVHVGTSITSGLRFSPDDSRLVAFDDHGEVVVWSVTASATAEIYRTAVPGVLGVLFMTPGRILVQDGAAIRVIPLAASDGPAIVAKTSNVVAIDGRPDAVVTGTRDGTIELRSSALKLTSAAMFCRARLTSVQFVPGRNQFAFSCHDGSSGLVQFDHTLSAMTMIDTFPTRASAYALVDPTGQYVVLTDETRTAYLYDVGTRLVHRYEGHAGVPNFVAPPTPEFPHVLTGDGSGIVHLWNPPDNRARVVLRAPVPLYGFAIDHDAKLVLSIGNERVAHGFDFAAGEPFELPSDTSELLGLQIAPDGSSMLTYSYDASVRVWRTSDRKLLRTVTAHKGMVGEVDYVDPGTIVSVAADGKLLAWSPEGTRVTVLFEGASPLLRLEVLATNHHVVVDDITGAVWDIAQSGVATQVRKGDGAAIARLRASRDGKRLAVGTDAGAIELYDTTDWRIIRRHKTEGGIRQLAFDPLDRDLLIASEAKHGQLGSVQLLPLDARRVYHWTEVAANVRDVAYAPDGDTLGFVDADGGTWLYCISRDQWVHANDERTDTIMALFSGDGRQLVSINRRGALIMRDVAASFRPHEGFVSSPD